MKAESEAFQDAQGDILRVSKDERGWWVEVEERVGGEAVQTAAVGPLSRREARKAREVLAPLAWHTRLGGPVLLIPPAAGLLGLGPWLGGWGAAVALWLALYLAVDAG